MNYGRPRWPKGPCKVSPDRRSDHSLTKTRSDQPRTPSSDGGFLQLQLNGCRIGAASGPLAVGRSPLQQNPRDQDAGDRRDRGAAQDAETFNDIRLIAQSQARRQDDRHGDRAGGDARGVPRDARYEVVAEGRECQADAVADGQDRPQRQLKVHFHEPEGDAAADSERHGEHQDALFELALGAALDGLAEGRQRRLGEGRESAGQEAERGDDARAGALAEALPGVRKGLPGCVAERHEAAVQADREEEHPEEAAREAEGQQLRPGDPFPDHGQLQEQQEAHERDDGADRVKEVIQQRRFLVDVAVPSGADCSRRAAEPERQGPDAGHGEQGRKRDDARAGVAVLVGRILPSGTCRGCRVARVALAQRGHKAGAAHALPPGLRTSHLRGLTGRLGSRGGDAQAERQDDRHGHGASGHCAAIPRQAGDGGHLAAKPNACQGANEAHHAQHPDAWSHLNFEQHSEGAENGREPHTDPNAKHQRTGVIEDEREQRGPLRRDVPARFSQRVDGWFGNRAKHAQCEDRCHDDWPGAPQRHARTNELAERH
mmetsp:Transcript_74760/g.228734  ORF Transcript_74760/g.228734 Transcript_74760/m.228734 type:complete len:544 (-) Transcript_74760:386-2017(-)